MGLSDNTYWERLKILKLFSQERRLERYRVIYIWKSLEKLIPECGLESYVSLRRGRLVKVKPLSTQSSAKTKSIRDGSFMINGPRLFNSLPANIRDLTGCSVEAFKNHLDIYLSTLPDEPSCDLLQPSAVNQITGRQSNSIIDQARAAALAQP